MRRVLQLSLGMLFFALAGAYSLVTPAWEASDERQHYDYLRTILLTGRPPIQSVAQPNLGHHPPTYYYLAAALAWPADVRDDATLPQFNPLYAAAGNGGRDPNYVIHSTAETFPYAGHALALHLGRLASVLISTVTVLLIVEIGFLAYSARPEVGLLAGAIAAFNPEFLFVSGAMTNDVLVTLAGTGAFAQLLRVLRAPRSDRALVLLGVWLGLGLISKFTAIAACAAVGLILTIGVARTRTPRQIVQGALSLILPVALMAGWWFVRNWSLYGDPLGYRIYRQAWWPSLRISPLTGAELGTFAWLQFRSFWAWFGWMNVPGPSWVHAGYLAVVIAAALGLIASAAGLVRAGRPSADRGTSPPGGWWDGTGREALLAALVFLAVQEAYLVALILDCNASCYQGRYLFAALGPIALLLSAGLLALVPSRLACSAAGVGALAMAAVAVAVPQRVIAPAYAIVPLPKTALDRLPRVGSGELQGGRAETLPKLAMRRPPQPPRVIVGDAFELVAMQTRLDRFAHRLVVTLYWRARGRPDFDYSAFVHLIDDRGDLVAQKDHAPGEGRRFPPTSWAVGDLIADDHAIALPPDLAPASYRLRTGLYNWSTGAQLPIRVDGRDVGGHWIVPGTIAVG